MPTDFVPATYDPSTLAALAAVVTSNNATGTHPGNTASIPVAQIVDPITPPTTGPKQQISTVHTTATCPVDGTVIKIGAGSFRVLPVRCPKCGYSKMIYT